MFLIYLAAVAGAAGSESFPSEMPTADASPSAHRDETQWRAYCRAAGKAAADRAMKSPKLRLPPPTVDQMIHCTPDETFGEYERRLDEAERAPRTRPGSVDDTVRAALVDKTTHFPQQDLTPVHAEASMQAAAEAAYAEQKRSSPQATRPLAPDGANLGAVTTGAIGLVVGALATLAMRRRRRRPGAQGDAASHDSSTDQF